MIQFSVIESELKLQGEGNNENTTTSHSTNQVCLQHSELRGIILLYSSPH